MRLCVWRRICCDRNIEVEVGALRVASIKVDTVDDVWSRQYEEEQREENDDGSEGSRSDGVVNQLKVK